MKASADIVFFHHVIFFTVKPFVELARTVAANWKSADNETKDYCTTVERILKERHAVLIKIRYLYTIDSARQEISEEVTPELSKSKGSLGSHNEMKRRQVKKPRMATHALEGKQTKQCSIMQLPSDFLHNINPGSQGGPKEEITSELTYSTGIFCLPTKDPASCPGSQIEMTLRQVDISKRATHALEDKPIKVCTAMHLPEGFSPVAREQSTVNSRGIGRTCLMDMYQKYHHNLSTTISDTPNMLDYYSSSTRCTLKDRQVEVAEVRGVTLPSAIDSANQGPLEEITRRSTDIICCLPTMNYASSVSQIDIDSCFDSLTMISNEIGVKFSSGDRPTMLGMAPRHEECRFLNDRRRHSAPERRKISDKGQPRETYDIQELDIADSDVVGMWHSS
jgi:hypothetical protein